MCVHWWHLVSGCRPLDFGMGFGALHHVLEFLGMSPNHEILDLRAPGGIFHFPPIPVGTPENGWYAGYLLWWLGIWGGICWHQILHSIDTSPTS